MPHEIIVSAHGGPEVLQWRSFESRAPGAGEARIRQTAVGVNFIDVYFRTGAYPTPSCPFPIGQEAAGVVDAVGPDVTDFAPGDRVAYGTGMMGSYAEERVVPTGLLVKVPLGIDDRTAAAVMLKGMTAEYLLRRTYPVRAGDTVLVQAAAGGVGHLLCQWAKHLGATVIGTVGSDAKAKLASENGCDHPIVYTKESVAERVRQITDGAGVSVVYDSVGKATFEASLDSLRPRGVLALYGQSSGKVAPFDPQILNYKGSLFLTRPSLVHHAASREDLLASTGALFAVIEKGAVKPRIGQTFALSDAAKAHAALEGRKTTGSTVLLP